MESQYVTEDPVIFTVCAAAIFVFTSLVFVSYDYLVARRQRIVMNQALASGAIVSSLFPERVKEQLYREKKAALGQEKTSEFLSSPQADMAHSRPIAELFEETTIFFADLAGFTKWSSSRTPVEVFDLLETLYGAFDKIAKKRKVFKVETIGDCYVAVTGIPEAQPDHAVIMVKFAHDCLAKMNQLTSKLADMLGEDTTQLEMRVGLHSGKTTGGVLRGEKGRFQLFGDTVNTASRMESNGVKGKIHVSQATADALILEGKKNWLTPRKDLVLAKGKGEMQTFFVSMDTGEPKSNCSSYTLSESFSSPTGAVGEQEPSSFEQDEPSEHTLDEIEDRLAQRFTQNAAGAPAFTEM